MKDNYLHMLNKLAKNTTNIELTRSIYDFKTLFLDEHGTPTGEWHKFTKKGYGQLIRYGAHTFHTFQLDAPEGINAFTVVNPPTTSDLYEKLYASVAEECLSGDFFKSQINDKDFQAKCEGELNDGLREQLEYADDPEEIEDEIQYNAEEYLSTYSKCRFWGIGPENVVEDLEPEMIDEWLLQERVFEFVTTFIESNENQKTA